MLMHVMIKNFVTINELSLDFSSGTTVITGETGTGKSILIDAIELALGRRVSDYVLNPDQEKTDISLTFDISKIPHAKAWLQHYDLAQGTDECIIRRTVNKENRSRSFINGLPTTLQPLRELSELLIDIHGQHEHQSLLKSEKQREMLDDFAGHVSLVTQLNFLAEEYRRVQDEIATLRTLTQERNLRAEFLSFQLNELDALHITPDEFQLLDHEHKQLAHADELVQNMHLALNCLTENEEQNALQCLNQALHALESIQHVNQKISPWIDNLKNALIQINDTENELRRSLETVEMDPNRLTQIEERISTLFNLARKHKISPNELYEFQQKLAAEFRDLEKSDERLTELANKLSEIEQQYQEIAKKLSRSRRSAAEKLEKEISALIHQLALPKAEFNIVLDQENCPAFSAHGLEKIIFKIKTNAGPLQPLAKIVSGGELSRISLAIHIATAEQHTIPTLIFDEVDVGISGSTAEIVGKLLRRLGKTHQVLCITHLPQVAAQGLHHIRVEKETRKDVTKTHIQFLSVEDKIQEIARMLGGVAITQKTLAHAREMVENSD